MRLSERASFELHRDLVRTILNQATKYEWSLQGFGMFRLYLSRERRLHVWAPLFRVPKVTAIHTHPWDFTSLIVSGQMIDISYTSVWSPDDNPYPPTHYVQSIICGPGGGKVGKSSPVRLINDQTIIYGRGHVYSRPAARIHESSPSEGCITIIDRRFKADTEHAEVFYPVGQDWISAEPRPALSEEVAIMSKMALERFHLELAETASK